MDSPFKGKHGPLLIAEIGGNHEGDFEYAKKLTQMAIDTDVDYVKFQIYTGDSLVSKLESPRRNNHFKKFELSNEQHIELAKMVIDAGLNYTSSVWDLSAMDWIDSYIPIYKIGSGDVTAYPVLRATAKLGKPMILSTGLSTEDEVLASIKFIQKVNPVYNSSEMLAVLQCTSMYPIQMQDAHLNVMQRLKEITNLTIGYSDHTEGNKALKYAVAMGADVLEFHFTDRREGQDFRDHKVSLMPEEVKELIQEIKLIKSLQGEEIKKPTQIELKNDHEVSFRRAVYPSRDIQKGEVLTEENLTVLRPNHGIDARRFDELIGSRVSKDLLMHQKLTDDLIMYKKELACSICGSTKSDLVSVLEKKPALEMVYLPENIPYKRQIRRCNGCGVYFNVHDYDLFNQAFYSGQYNSSIEKGQLQKRFDRITNLPKEDSDNKQRVDRVFSFCEKNFSKSKEIRLLDIGSGSGVFPFEMAKKYSSVSAVDPDPNSIELMRNNMNLIDLWQGSIGEVPKSNKYEIITFNKVLEHIKDPKDLLNQAIERLSKDGIIYIELPFAEKLIEQGIQDERSEFFIEHYTTFTFSSLLALIESQNLVALEIQSIIDPSGKQTIYCFSKLSN